jgi:hypothetical protein
LFSGHRLEGPGRRNTIEQLGRDDRVDLGAADVERRHVARRDRDLFANAADLKLDVEPGRAVEVDDDVAQFPRLEVRGIRLDGVTSGRQVEEAVPPLSVRLGRLLADQVGARGRNRRPLDRGSLFVGDGSLNASGRLPESGSHLEEQEQR